MAGTTRNRSWLSSRMPASWLSFSSSVIFATMAFARASGVCACATAPACTANAVARPTAQSPASTGRYLLT